MSNVSARELVSVKKCKDIRFLTLVSTLTRGGTERAAVNFALGYHRAGFPSAVLAYGGGGPRQALLEEAGIPVFVGGHSPFDVAHATEEAKAWAPDILHLNREGKTDSRSASVLRALIHPRLRVLETNVFSYVDASPDRVLIDLHLHLSNWCLWKWTQSAQGLEPKSPAVVVPYPVDSESFLPVAAEERASCRRHFGIPESAFVFGRVGQPSPAKWSPVLLHAFREVAQKLPNAWLVVCGLPKTLQPLVDKLPEGIRSRIVGLPITNSDAELHRYYALMDVFAHASKIGESFGMVLCEAMLSGVPVITVSTPLRDNSQIEVVANGRTGIVVQNQEQLIDAMLKVHEDKALLQSMQQNAREWVRERFDISVVSRLLLILAPIALASISSQDLARRLAVIPEIHSAAPPNLYGDLLRSAGIRPSFLESNLTSLINQPLCQRAIDFVRAVRVRMR